MRFVLVCAFVLMAYTVSAEMRFYDDTVSASADDAGCSDSLLSTWGITSQKMYIGYHRTGPTAMENLVAQFRFQDCEIPRASYVDSCALGLMAAAGGRFYLDYEWTDSCTIHWIVYTVDSGNAPDMSGETTEGQCAWSTIDEKNWTFDSSWTDGVRAWQYGFDSLLQKTVVRPSYQAGNAIRFQICDEHDCVNECDSSNYAVVYAYDNKTSATYRPSVHVAYRVPIESLLVSYVWADYPTAIDSFDISAYVNDAFVAPDSLKFAISDTDYPDSSVIVTVPHPGVEGWVTVTVGGISATEDDPIYASAWLLRRTHIDPQLTFDSVWSERSTATTTLTAQLQISGAIIQGVTIE